MNGKRELFETGLLLPSTLFCVLAQLAQPVCKDIALRGEPHTACKQRRREDVDVVIRRLLDVGHLRSHPVKCEGEDVRLLRVILDDNRNWAPRVNAVQPLQPCLDHACARVVLGKQQHEVGVLVHTERVGRGQVEACCAEGRAQLLHALDGTHLGRCEAHLSLAFRFRWQDLVGFLKPKMCTLQLP